MQLYVKKRDLALSAEALHLLERFHNLRGKTRKIIKMYVKKARQNKKKKTNIVSQS